jgi:hypothetical protein
MSIGTSAGTTIGICTTATTANDQTALAALTYVTIGKVESLGEIGPQSQDVTFTPLAGDTVQHLKGATDNGAITIVCARDPLDAGQIGLLAAAATKLEYAFKISENDGADANDTDTITYVRGPVMGGRKTIGGANDVTKRTFMVGLNQYIEIPSTAVS